MGKHDEIRKALGAFAGRFGPTVTVLGTIVSVDDQELTCVIEDDEDIDPIEGVRLRPVLDGHESMTIFPTVGSWALAIRLEESEEWMLIAAGELNKVRIKAGDLIFEMEELFLLQKENETLKKILKDLILAIKSITVDTNNGPSSVPLNVAAFTTIGNRVDNFLK